MNNSETGSPWTQLENAQNSKICLEGLQDSAELQRQGGERSQTENKAVGMWVGESGNREGGTVKLAFSRRLGFGPNSKKCAQNERSTTGELLWYCMGRAPS